MIFKIGFLSCWCWLAIATAQGQLTIKDFKLCLDQVRCTDTVLRITKADLLQCKKITPNFAWFTIDSATIYIGEGNYTSETFIIHLPKDAFTVASKKIFERLKPNTLLSITVWGHNRQNRPIDWGSLTLKIVEQ